METLLLEIGSEEIPAGYIDPALKALSANLTKQLTNARIQHSDAKVFGTPRRLAVQVGSVASKQTSVQSEIIGPPAKVGFDTSGRPTVAAQKFAEKVGVTVDKLMVKKTPKGDYLSAHKTERGQLTRTLLKEILPEVILATPFPKKMRWANLDIEFARPIHYIVAMLGKSVIVFQLGDIKSNRYTRGHYFMAPNKIKLTHADDYVKALKSVYVVVDINARKKMLQREIDKVAGELGGDILPDEELLDINTNLVEYPIAVVGKFDEEFLEVPDEVLINAMREHQKYFSVVNRQGKLQPGFISINNTRAKDMTLVASGHERVIRARLADAQFFYRGDLEVSNDDRVKKLKGVLFQAKLGTMHAKMKRIRRVAKYIAGKIEDQDKKDAQKADLKKRVGRAAELCKSDLVSQVVGEFPKLQGVMGRIYAAVAGELPTVAAAVEEHYRPVHSGAALPQTTVGATLSIADKIDSICGCFSVGLVPTGASDPYALRRQGIGIIQIMQNKAFSISLRKLILTCLKQFDIKSKKQIEATAEKVHVFLKNRISHLLAEEGYSKDIIAAVVDVSADDVPNTWNRVAALEALKKQKDFEALVAGFKRVVNILKKSGKMERAAKTPAINAKLFEDKSETALYAAYQQIEQTVIKAMQKAQYDQALKAIASLRESVDHFFDDVMVMTDDKRIRNNRLNLLGHIAGLFGKFADFSKIST